MLGNHRLYSLCLGLIAAVAIILTPLCPRAAVVIGGSHQLCDPVADYYLGIEDYAEAIKRHVVVLERHPDNALAHYHLGFAFGMTGNHEAELRQYQEAIELGLSDWELFLNLGLLHLEKNRVGAAADVLQLATLLAPEKSEAHFNLGIAYERLGEFPKAEQEILLSLRLNSDQPDAHNMLGVVFAEQGNFARAREEWNDLIRELPAYEPARVNLRILAQAERAQLKPSEGGTGQFKIR